MTPTEDWGEGGKSFMMIFFFNLLEGRGKTSEKLCLLHFAFCCVTVMQKEPYFNMFCELTPIG